MPDLIDKLKAEHTEIIDTLLRVKALIGKHEHGREMLMAAKEMLIAHLKSEDTELYPVLLKSAAKDERLGKQLADLRAEMERVSDIALRFFDKYSISAGAAPAEKPGESLIDRLKRFFSPKAEPVNGGFEQDFGELYTLLLDRIQKEENILYTAYLKRKKV